jgi:hypothetical protein
MSKGRNRNLVDRRDEKLLARYYYWTEVERIRFDDALRVLSEEEFFLSEERIMRIVRDKYDSFRKDAVAGPPVKSKKHRPVVPAQLLLFKGG